MGCVKYAIVICFVGLDRGSFDLYRVQSRSMAGGPEIAARNLFRTLRCRTLSSARGFGRARIVLADLSDDLISALLLQEGVAGFKMEPLGFLFCICQLEAIRIVLQQLVPHECRP